MKALITPPAVYSSGAVCQRLDETHRKLQLALAANMIDLARHQVEQMNRLAAYLKANFPITAIERGPAR